MASSMGEEIETLQQLMYDEREKRIETEHRMKEMERQLVSLSSILGSERSSLA